MGLLHSFKLSKYYIIIIMDSATLKSILSPKMRAKGSTAPCLCSAPIPVREESMMGVDIRVLQKYTAKNCGEGKEQQQEEKSETSKITD